MFHINECNVYLVDSNSYCNKKQMEHIRKSMKIEPEFENGLQRQFELLRFYFLTVLL